MAQTTEGHRARPSTDLEGAGSSWGRPDVLLPVGAAQYRQDKSGDQCCPPAREPDEAAISSSPIGARTGLVALLALALPLLCCGLPVLVAGGLLAGVGGWLAANGSWLAATVAGILALGFLGGWWRRRLGHRARCR